MTTDAIAAVDVIMGENSYPYIGRSQFTDEGGVGPLITRDTVLMESGAMLDVMINRLFHPTGEFGSSLYQVASQQLLNGIYAFEGYGRGELFVLESLAPWRVTSNVIG